ncbi:MAG: hypothetical protein CEE38_20170 [Planctomycetes bacterium B3_Pla]|nr:MAG: hypothetical protein CEE38_20170 [Planctomycetes bacterium B3_Pla]
MSYKFYEILRPGDVFVRDRFTTQAKMLHIAPYFPDFGPKRGYRPVAVAKKIKVQKSKCKISEPLRGLV